MCLLPVPLPHPVLFPEGPLGLIELLWFRDSTPLPPTRTQAPRGQELVCLIYLMSPGPSSEFCDPQLTHLQIGVLSQPPHGVCVHFSDHARADIRVIKTLK